MNAQSRFAEARRAFHAGLASGTLTIGANGVPSNADVGSKTSVSIARHLARLVGARSEGPRGAGQTSGKSFEKHCLAFLKSTFLSLAHLRPGNWSLRQVSGANRFEIAQFEQYAHLTALAAAAARDPELAAALGTDYTIAPDIVIGRLLEDDAVINAADNLIDEGVAQLSSLRASGGGLPLLHASISCKWTLRSDRAQNARSEALNLIRNRKGHLPHVVVVTAEPLPSRLTSIALGTGDIDCVYHFALPELLEAVKAHKLGDADRDLETMVRGKRLKDIADLPLDLAV